MTAQLLQFRYLRMRLFSEMAVQTSCQAQLCTLERCLLDAVLWGGFELNAKEDSIKLSILSTAETTKMTRLASATHMYRFIAQCYLWQKIVGHRIDVSSAT